MTLFPKDFDIPQGYGAEVIKGQKPVTAEYEPFTPAAIFNVASYTENITQPGTYYVAVVSPADETQYSIAVGYLEEFSVSEWILVPVSVINTHIWEGQSIIVIFAPFLAIMILGLILITRREQTNQIKKTTVVLACNDCRIMLFRWRIHSACPDGPGPYGNGPFCWCDHHPHPCFHTNHTRYLDSAHFPFNIPAIQKGSVLAGNHRAPWTAILGRAYYRAGNCLYCSSGTGTILTQLLQSTFLK